ncbi:MAG: PH domain-containing protein [Phycisphaerales bacterium]
MPDHPTLRTAEFNRANLKKYWLWQPVLICVLTVVLIPVLPFALLIVWLVVDKYLDRLSCELTTKTLEVRKGLLNRVESTVPLEKITDVQYYQGPIMRMLDIEGFRVETAGQSAGATGYLVNMIGMKDTRGFRQAVLAQRDKLADKDDDTPRRREPSDAAPADGSTLSEIRDILARIERKLPDQPG